MNAGPRRIWRPLRSFLILICVGGAVLAADNTWLTDLRFEFNAADWWSNISPVEAPNADMALASGPAIDRAPELSMERLLHGLLFSKPSTDSWRLAAEKTEVTSAWMTQQSGGTFTSLASSNYFQPSFFSSTSGFVTSSGSVAPAPPTTPTASGNWTLNGSGDWGVSGNWAGGVIADGAGNNAHFDLLDITTNVTVTLATSRTIGHVYLGDTNGTHTYNIAPSSGATLTFDDNTTDFQVHSILQQDRKSVV